MESEGHVVFFFIFSVQVTFPYFSHKAKKHSTTKCLERPCFPFTRQKGQLFSSANQKEKFLGGTKHRIASSKWWFEDMFSFAGEPFTYPLHVVKASFCWLRVLLKGCIPIPPTIPVKQSLNYRLPREDWGTLGNIREY